MEELVYRILAAVGGVGVVVIGFSKLFGKILQDRLKEQERRRTEMALEANRQRYGLRRLQADKFVQSQYEIYLELWETLQALLLVVDALWDTVSKQNIANLLRQLRTTEQKIKDSAPFFEDEHYEELKRLFDFIESFRTGKLALYEIRSKRDLDYLKVDEIKQQIEENHAYKEQLEYLLDSLRRNFRERLSTIDDENLIQ